MKEWIAGAALVMGLGLGITALGYFLPGYIVGKIQKAFEWAKKAAWMRDPAHPHRLKLLRAATEFLEKEIPEPGEGKELYAALGADIAGSHVLLAGTGPKWASVLEKCGDAIDTELDAEIKELDS